MIDVGRCRYSEKTCPRPVRMVFVLEEVAVGRVPSPLPRVQTLPALTQFLKVKIENSTIFEMLVVFFLCGVKAR